ncbi:MAG: 16S rRNA (cytidine(1402)-2'-O)-methyltransferase [Kiloniellales bacterium]
MAKRTSTASSTAPRAEPSEATGRSKPSPPLAAGLYLVATPIGNLGDLTLRARDTLAAADRIACEDSRVTAKLLARYGIARPLAAYHEHNAARMRPKLLAEIAAGKAVALVSDAGTPLVSDPGYKLVTEALDRGIPVTALPGASAVLTALQLSGLPSDRFLFAGFAPTKAGERRRWLEELAEVKATLIFFEAPGRLAASLAAAAEALGPRPAAVARELTKRFEEVRRAPLDALAAHYAETGAPKGELVIAVGPPGERPGASDAALDGLLRQSLKRSSLRDAVAEVAAASGRSRRAVYARALALAEDRDR